MGTMPRWMSAEQGGMVGSPRQPLARVAALVVHSRNEQAATVLDARISAGVFGLGHSIGAIGHFLSPIRSARATVGQAVPLLQDRGLLHVRLRRRDGLSAVATGTVVRMRQFELGMAELATIAADAIGLHEHLDQLIDAAATKHRGACDIEERRANVATVESAATEKDCAPVNSALQKRFANIVSQSDRACRMHRGPRTFDGDKDADNDVGPQAYRRERVKLTCAAA